MASSSSSGLGWKYDVFINFRGEDTRRGFVSHLYNALAKKPINAFIDAEKLRKGDHLSELLTAIRESRISIVVFSQDYASSTWCLKELVQILECKDTNKQIVLPIFYEVDPSDVRKRKRSFAEAFAQHDRDSNAEMEEVRSWTSALTTATSLSGWDSRNYENDAVLIEEIVEDVYRKLIDISSSSWKENGLVEMDSHMHKMHLLLYPSEGETNDVRVVGIWGMGGLGKTTIAKAVYDEIACRFAACCFLKNVKEGFMKHGELHMQTQLLSSISDNKVGSSHISSKGFQVMLKSLGQRKVLIVVDDVDKLEQIEALLGEQHSFGGGSRIIITSRDSQLLSIADEIYNPKTLSDSGALKLFRQHAFRNNQPTRDYDDLSNRVVEYAQGLPLALKVLGAFLRNKTIREWEDELEKIRKIPRRGIHDVLKSSFDGLDETEKDIFLDIACFFKGMEKDHATRILDGCGFHPHTGIRVLIDRALITVSEKGELEMHDSLEEMGREIVRQESIKEPGGRSRLWSYEDVHHVLTQNTATKAIESIIVDFSYSDWVCLNAEAFVSMTQLRLIKINLKDSVSKHDYCKHPLIGPYKLLNLRYLSWFEFPLKSLPSNFQFKNLVELDMQFSLIDRLWEGTQTLEKLKFINLSYCEYLKETPDFTNVPNLERLILQCCTSLVEVHPSISTLTNLVLLNLNSCHELKILPSNIRMKSLKTFNLFGCWSLEMFPEISEVIEGLEELDLCGSRIKELPPSINNLTGLSHFNLKDCKELKSLPSKIRMRSLKTFNLSGCSNLEMFPEISEGMEELKELNLSWSKIKELPSSINNLTGLSHLNLEHCMELKSLPSNIRMKSLKTFSLYGCSNLEMFPEILEGSKIKELPSSINNLTGLSHLNLIICQELKSLPSSIRMKSLKTFNLYGCSSLEMFPEILEGMEELEELNLSCSKIKELPLSINNLTGLSHFKLKNCKELKSLPSCIHMKCLKTFNLYGCSNLEMFPSISEGIEGLEELDLSGSRIKELPPSINNLTGLSHLNLSNCKELKRLPSSIRMKSLKTFSFFGCSSLEMFPEILEVIEGLEELDLSGSRIKELTLSINNLIGLSHLNLSNCKELKILPSKIRMRSLKTFNLSGCSSLEMFPEISEVIEGLEELDLSGSRIKELPPSINNLTGLSHLNLSNCKELKILPSKIRMRSLKTFNLSGCSNLIMFPEISEVIEGLEELDLSGSRIKELPRSINNLTGLSHLNLSNCKELKILPGKIRMRSLKTFNLSSCSSLEMFPEISEGMQELEELNLSGSKIKELPLSINNLTGLSHFNLKDCKELKSLPSCIHMKCLKTFNLYGCSSLEMFPSISEGIEGLEKLDLPCSKIKELSPSINNLTRLCHLNLHDCKELKSLPSSICMKSLKSFDLYGCWSLEMFPEISEEIEGLKVLDLSGSKIKEMPSSINNLTGLNLLKLENCKELKSLPSSICQLKSLVSLSLSGCTKFDVFPSIEENMEGLRNLFLDGTSIKELSPWIERLTELRYLYLRDCKSLVHRPNTLCNLYLYDPLEDAYRRLGLSPSPPQPLNF
ncbi:TMV resistance protein N-like [Pyrus ussuriensis x Pyrus communis]|uniref:ADP-ribosyl cyclase/cyclic ADP-ribose hydrolase n=1 Tax=Pyrus ussuriensis x Pyrus communis TaxID=2448454 RepID=A0A5N5F0C1_9ROSA|nr:TMV resistance protein N-like [Pyrus ussuriensis x Pyrus communis]